jgi:hypothetical protein
VPGVDHKLVPPNGTSGPQTGAIYEGRGGPQTGLVTEDGSLMQVGTAQIPFRDFVTGERVSLPSDIHLAVNLSRRRSTVHRHLNRFCSIEKVDVGDRFGRGRRNK